MAFTESQKLSISQILGITPTLLDAQITSLGATLTAAKETAILEQVTLWQSGIGSKTTKLHPKESNKGVETNPMSARADIQRNIAVLLEMSAAGYSTNGIGTLQIGI